MLDWREMLTSIKNHLAQHLLGSIPLSENEIFSMLEMPKDLSHGHLAFPTFRLAKELKKSPPAIAEELSKKISCGDFLGSVNSVGGFLNFKFKSKFIQNEIIESIILKKEIGHTNTGNGRKVVVDYSSPNVAKPLGIGHLRATVIGQAICNLARTQGYEVLGLNYIGDWGVQFGKLAWAYTNWKEEYDFENAPFESLYEMYVRFHSEAENDPEMNENGAEFFRRLESGDAEVEKLWKSFIEITMEEHQKLYALLGIEFDLVQGESFYNDKMEAAVQRLKEKQLLVESEGAQVVYINEKDPPCLIKKSDGSSLYATRDIASAIYRHEEMKGEDLLYVVGADQSLHFKQVFGVLEKLGYEWAKNCQHIAFGLYRFKDGKMSTRKGNLIFMKDVIHKSIEIAGNIIQQKNPNLENKSLVASQVGVGAIVFNDLVNDRVKNVEFDWERALDFEGDSGPYVQYCVVRCKSLIRKYGKTIEKEFQVDLDSPEEQSLQIHLLHFEDILGQSWKHRKPNLLAQYLLKVCSEFNHFYNKQRIIGSKPEVEASRMTLVHSVQRVLEKGLEVLGIPAPDQM